MLMLIPVHKGLKQYTLQFPFLLCRGGGVGGGEGVIITNPWSDPFLLITPYQATKGCRNICFLFAALIFEVHTLLQGVA